MQALHIATTPRASLESLRYQGIAVTESHAQLQSMLRNNLSPEHALFLAEPVPSGDGAAVDWYTQREGEVRTLASLPPEEQEAALQEIRRLAGDIAALAESLKQSGEGSKGIRGNILSLALDYPGPEYIYVVGGRPLLLCWGFSSASALSRPEELMRLGAGAPLTVARSSAVPDPAAGPAAPERSSGWARAALFLLLGLLISLGLLFLAGMLLTGTPSGRPGCAPSAPWPVFNATGGCAPGTGGLPERNATLPAPELQSALTAEREKERSLRRRLEDLRRQLGLRLAECPRPQKEEPRPEPPKAEEPKIPAPPPPEEPPSLADLLPTTPEPPAEPPAPVKPPKPVKPPEPVKPPKPRVAKGDTLEIPDGAREKNDLSFLEGCWYCETGLYSSATGEPVTVLYCFDDKGRGSRTVKEKKTGGQCKGSARAQFDAAGKLRIRGEKARCSSSGSFVPQTVECRQQGRKAGCFGSEESRRGTRWRATFRRT